MARFVCLLLASFVACSQAGEDTLVEKCKDVCKILGDFIREDKSVHTMIPEWLESNGLMDGEWDCDHVAKVAGKVGQEMEKLKDQLGKEEMEKGEEMNKAIQEMAKPLVRTIEDNSSDDCKQKFEDIMSQIM